MILPEWFSDPAFFDQWCVCVCAHLCVCGVICILLVHLNNTLDTTPVTNVFYSVAEKPINGISSPHPTAVSSS